MHAGPSPASDRPGWLKCDHANAHANVQASAHVSSHVSAQTHEQLMELESRLVPVRVTFLAPSQMAQGELLFGPWFEQKFLPRLVSGVRGLCGLCVWTRRAHLRPSSYPLQVLLQI